MCGIFLAWHKNGQKIEENNLNICNSLMKHRGPDDSGICIEGTIGFAHTRLSITGNTINAHQPMRSYSQKTIFAYNGEIYNSNSLRSTLYDNRLYQENGSDSRVVLEYLEAKGIISVKNLNGMFALVAYNIEKNEISIARDRYGAKPLYYFDNSNYLVISSEIRTIINYLKKNREKKLSINYQPLAEFFTYQNILSGETLINEIKSFPKGHYSIINLNNTKEMKPEKFWWPTKNIENRNEAEQSEDMLNFLIEKSFDSQIMGNVKYGAFLSGGIDSSLISLKMRKKIENLCAFTIGFEEINLNTKQAIGSEHVEASKFAKELELCGHLEIINAQNVLPSLANIASAIEEPRVGQSYPNYYAARLASTHSRVVFSGAGSDELFGGYPWRYSLDYTFEEWKDQIDHYYHSSHKVLSEKEACRIFNFNENIYNLEKNRSLFKQYFTDYEEVELNLDNKIMSYLNYDFEVFLPGLLLIEDKLGMSFSIETRFPFLDNELVDFVKKMPGSKLIKRQKSGKFQGKIPLRSMLQKDGHSLLSSREKQGFSGPDAAWFQNNLRNELIRIFNDDLHLWGVLDQNQAKCLLNEHIAGQSRRNHFIWSVLLVENLLNKYVSEI